MSQQQNTVTAKYFYRASAADFMKIPGSPVIYWVSDKVSSLFKLRAVGDLVFSQGSVKTGNNEKYVRNHWEVSGSGVGYNLAWRLHPRGGDFRKWYGNVLEVVNWSDDAKKHYRKDHVARIPDQEYWDLEGVCWSEITSSETSFRVLQQEEIANNKSLTIYPLKPETRSSLLGYFNSKISKNILNFLNPTISVGVGDIVKLPWVTKCEDSLFRQKVDAIISLSKEDWDSYEISWSFTTLPLLRPYHHQSTLKTTYQELRSKWCEIMLEMQRLEEENNRLFIEAYGLQDELTPDVPQEEITLTCNPHYRYSGNRSEKELETLLQCDTLRELVSYAIGCMMGRYSLDKPGLILASQGETLQDYLRQIPSPRFAPDDDAILPLTDQEWFADDATNRFREFIRVVWGDETLQENLGFVAESLCLHAIKPKKGEASLDTIRRYLSTQFFKDHLRTYKKRPIYWLFSSGKHKAFECLVYLHRYNEGTLARMRTEYVIPLTAKLSTHAAKLEKDVEASTSTAEKKRLEKELTTLHNQQAELAAFDETLRHYADQRISLDLDDGVKVNYGKFGDLLAEVKAVTGGAADD